MFRTKKSTDWNYSLFFVRNCQLWIFKLFRKIQDEEINVYRMFLGREENKDVELFLYDSKGKERIKIYIDASDNARFEILDKNGKQISTGSEK